MHIHSESRVRSLVVTITALFLANCQNANTRNLNQAELKSENLTSDGISEQISTMDLNANGLMLDDYATSSSLLMDKGSIECLNGQSLQNTGISLKKSQSLDAKSQLSGIAAIPQAILPKNLFLLVEASILMSITSEKSELEKLRSSLSSIWLVLESSHYSLEASQQRAITDSFEKLCQVFNNKCGIRASLRDMLPHVTVFKDSNSELSKLFSYPLWIVTNDILKGVDTLTHSISAEHNKSLYQSIPGSEQWKLVANSFASGVQVSNCPNATLNYSIYDKKQIDLFSPQEAPRGISVGPSDVTPSSQQSAPSPREMYAACPVQSAETYCKQLGHRSLCGNSLKFISPNLEVPARPFLDYVFLKCDVTVFENSNANNIGSSTSSWIFCSEPCLSTPEFSTDKCSVIQLECPIR